jgi:aspartate racemase
MTKSMTNKHIGIAACSVEGAALCYRTLVSEGLKRLGNHQHPEVTMHTPSLSNYMDLLQDGQEDWLAAARVVVDSAQKLKAAGADFVICPDNTIHEGIDRVLDEFPLPILHIADVVAQAAVDCGMQKLLILGTRYTARSSYYQTATAKHNIECVMPTCNEVEEIDRVIWEELYWAEIKPSSLVYYQQVVERYQSLGCDGVVLGCTEIPLMLNEQNSPLPVLDSTRLLAYAALDLALEN